MFDIGSLFAGFFIVEWTIRTIMLFVVPRRLRPASANAWLLLIMVAPAVGTILFYMFSDPKLPKSRREKLKKVNTLTDHELTQLQGSNKGVFIDLQNADHQSIAKLATKLGGLPPMAGNKVQFFHEYDSTFKAIAKEVDSAEEYIHVQYFIAAMDESTQVIFDALARAVERGVKVRFMWDKVLSRAYRGNSDMEKFLLRAGADVQQMMPLSLVPGPGFTRPDLRNHRKAVIIDGRTAFTGSQNLVNSSYNRKDDIVNEEIVSKIEGPAVWQLNNVFRSDWFTETGQPLLDILEDEDIPAPAGRVTAQVLPSGPAHEYDNNLKFYTSMVYSAKKQIRIVVPYFIPDESFLDALIAAAHRGVDVTMINSEAIDKLLAGHAQRSYYDQLLKVGIKIYLYNKPNFLHTKQVIIDDEVAIFGSSNLDIRSFELDFELNTIIYDRQVVRELLAIESGYLQRSSQIDPKHWDKRSIALKMLDGLSRLTAAFQ